MRMGKDVVAAMLLAAAMGAAGCETTGKRQDKPIVAGENTPATVPSVLAGVLPDRAGGKTEKTDKADAAGGGARNITIVLPSIPKNTTMTVSPEMLEALKALSAEDFKARQEAVTKLQLAMGKHFQQMVLVQDMMIRIQTNLAEQLKQMTLTQDVESSAKVASLMELNAALSRWAIDVMFMPEVKRQAMIEWGLKAENMMLVARAYSRKVEVRAEMPKELAKLKTDTANVDWMLLQLLNDDDREVSLKTVDAIWDRAITPEMVDALWSRASAYAMNQVRPRQQKQRMVTVRGRTIQIYEQDQSYNRTQDAELAAELLTKAKAPVIADRLNDVFTDLAATVNNPNDSRWRSLISTNYGGDSAKAMIRLIEAYKPKEAVPFMLKALNAPAQDGNDTTVDNNNEKVRYSSRIDAAALLISVSGQNKEDFNVRKYSNYGDRWMLKGSVAEENELVKKLNAWWRAHAKEYGAEVPPEPKEEKKVEVPAKPRAGLVGPGVVAPVGAGVVLEVGPGVVTATAPAINVRGRVRVVRPTD